MSVAVAPARGAAPQDERDLYQGLVHVAVATYQDGRGNEDRAYRLVGDVPAGHVGSGFEAALGTGARRRCRIKATMP